MHALSWEAIVVSAVFFVGIGALLLWASVPHVYRSLLELTGQRTNSRSSATSWLRLLYGSLLFLVALFEIATYLVWLVKALRAEGE